MKNCNSRNCVHYLLPAFLGSLLTAFSVLQVYYFQVNDWDFSYFLHIPWSIAQGKGLVAPFAAQFELPFYAHHATPLIAVLAPVFYLFPSPYTLAILHGIAVSCCFFLLPILTREIFQSLGRERYLPTACFLVLFLFVYRPFIAAWRYETHMTTLVTPFVFWALILLHQGKLKGASVCCLVIALAQERAAVAVACLGAYAFLMLNLRIFGFALCVLASGYFVMLIKVYFPYVRSLLGSSIGYAFSGSIQPLHDIQGKFIFVIKFFAYTLCLPIAGKRAFKAALCSLPLLCIGIISSRQTMYAFGHHYQDLATPFLMSSACYGIIWIYELYERHGARISHYANTHNNFVLIAFLCLSLSFFASRFQNVAGVAFKIYANSDRAKISVLNQDIEKILKLNSDLVVYSQSSIGPRIALRHNRFTLTSGIVGKKFSQCVVVVSPLLGTYMLDNYAVDVAALHNNPSLRLVADTGRMLIFAAQDLADTELFPFYE